MDKTARGTCWSVTINNPANSDEECIALARQKSGWKVYGQREKGAAGTEHYQLMVTTPQVRFSAVKKAFPRAHIELARDRTALSKYVQKEDTRVGSLTEDQEMYPSLQKLWDMFAEYVSSLKGLHNDWSQDSWLKHFDIFIRIKIEEGYVVETMAVNPQIRSCIKQYGENIYNRSLRRQTDRQTEALDEVENIISEEEYNNGKGQEETNEETTEGTDDESETASEEVWIR